MKVYCRLEIHGEFAAASSEDIWLKKIIRMPYPPSVGLWITDGNFEMQIHELWYDTTNKSYTAYADSEKEIYEAMVRHQEHRPIEEIVEEYIEAGWEREKGYKDVA
jgi:hypothetical protein